MGVGVQVPLRAQRVIQSFAEFQSENGPNGRFTIERAILVDASQANSVDNEGVVFVQFASETKNGASAGVRARHIVRSFGVR